MTYDPIDDEWKIERLAVDVGVTQWGWYCPTCQAIGTGICRDGDPECAGDECPRDDARQHAWQHAEI